MANRRFPPPWTVEEQPACFVVRDHNNRRRQFAGAPSGRTASDRQRLACAIAGQSRGHAHGKSEAKAKRAKTAKTKKARTAGKTTKYNKTKKRTKTIRTGASGTDPCAAQQQAFENAQSAVDDLTNEINDPDLPPEVRRKAESEMRAATIKLGTAQRALEQCRRQNP
jgi:hypothetical protein